MRRNQFFLLGIAFVSFPLFIEAQTVQKKDTTMNRTVVVEQEYNPDIMDASKVNGLPKVEIPTVNKKEVEYAITATPLNNIPVGTMQIYTGKETQPSPSAGYARLGYGNYGNLDILGNYLFNLSDRDKLNIYFKTDGMNGTLNMPTETTQEWDAHYYRTRAAIDYLHQFNQTNLNIAADFGLSNFNYAPFSLDFKKQKFTSGSFHIGVKSTDETLPLQFDAETNLMLYNRQHNQTFGEITETQIRTLGTVTSKLSNEQQVTIGLKMNNLFYNNNDERYKELIKQTYENRTTVDLNPYYEINSNHWKLHLGANVDFSFGGGQALRVSPDITAQYVFAHTYVLYAKATGGRYLNDFRKLETYNPYLDPDTHLAGPIKDSYEQLNTVIGFKASPTPGLWFDLFGGYQNLKDDLYQNQRFSDEATRTYFINLGQTHTDNLYAGIRGSYEYKNLLTLSAEGIFHRWDAKDKKNDSENESITEVSIHNKALWMKPKIEFGLNAEIHPMPTLWIHLGYDYIQRAERNYEPEKKFSSVSNLNLGATYQLFKDISIYVKVNNLLNQKFQYYLLYPTEGFNFVGGLSCKF